MPSSSPIADLQTFVSRFSANASKAKQATSRAKQIEKIQLEEVKPSSRQSPYIRFEQEKKLYRNALEVENLAKGYGDKPLFSDLNLLAILSRQVAIALENARMYAVEQRRTAELGRALEQQRELDRLKNQFIQNVSHELRTPLAMVLGYAELLASGDLGELRPEQKGP